MFFMFVGQVGDFTGTSILMGSLLAADWVITVRAGDADWFRDAWKDERIRPCFRGRKSKGKAVRYENHNYRLCNRNRTRIMLGRSKNWPRVAMRCDSCAKTFLSAVAVACLFRRPHAIPHVL
jgi:hypothetical protein